VWTFSVDASGAKRTERQQALAKPNGSTIAAGPTDIARKPKQLRQTLYRLCNLTLEKSLLCRLQLSTNDVLLLLPIRRTADANPTRLVTVTSVASGVLLPKQNRFAEEVGMTSPYLDIFKKDLCGNPIWVDAVGDLEHAQLRLNQLASIAPGEYFVFDQRNHEIAVRLGSDRIEWT
jgi:hypothetical protein